MSDIRFCENNYPQGAEEVVKKLDDDGISYEVESCLGYCGDCAVGVFALVDDELMTAESPDELYEMIKEQIK